jgi:diguanylate cyclase (GGDEF)-like protein
MKKLEMPTPIGRIITITAIGVALSVIIFFLSEALVSSGSVGINSMLAVLAVVAGILAGSTLMLYAKLKSGAKAFEAFKEQASMDKLTELYNRSYLDPFLESEIDAANRAKQPISVIMVDMDHFKDINDTYGHVVGDHVLTIFAQVVLKCIRKTDIIARYGGDEFIVVLPSTDTETACSIADRIRSDVSETYIPPIDGVVISSIHCSVGVSTYPVHCDSKNTLLRTSDLALYKAKNSGRNCTMVYQEDFALS